MAAGLIAIFSAMGLNIYNIWDDGRAAETAAQTLTLLTERIGERRTEKNKTTAGFTPRPDDTDEAEGVEIGGVSYLGVMNIPALGLSLPVDSAWSYPKLRNSPCRYEGSIYDNTLVIAAHNYKSHFGNISVLVGGDAIILTDADGVEHNYSVVSISEVMPTDVGDVVNNGYDLTLFTCTYSGQARVVVKCMRT